MTDPQPLPEPPADDQADEIPPAPERVDSLGDLIPVAWWFTRRELYEACLRAAFLSCLILGCLLVAFPTGITPWDGFQFFLFGLLALPLALGEFWVARTGMSAITLCVILPLLAIVGVGGVMTEIAHVEVLLEGKLGGVQGFLHAIESAVRAFSGPGGPLLFGVAAPLGVITALQARQRPLWARALAGLMAGLLAWAASYWVIYDYLSLRTNYWAGPSIRLSAGWHDSNRHWIDIHHTGLVTCWAIGYAGVSELAARVTRGSGATLAQPSWPWLLVGLGISGVATVVFSFDTWDLYGWSVLVMLPLVALALVVVWTTLARYRDDERGDPLPLVPALGSLIAVAAPFATLLRLFSEAAQPLISLGRPLRTGRSERRGRARAGADSKRAWSCPRPAPAVAEVAPATRDALAEAWLSDARDEHAAIAAFNRLALELLALGAPAALIKATQQAALDEVEHAELCFSLASAYAGRELGPGAFPAALEPSPGRSAEPRAELRRLALESLVDGAFNEGTAARLAAGLDSAGVDPAAHAVLRRQAVDEQRHAELGWRIVDWALERDPRLADELRAAAAGSPAPALESAGGGVPPGVSLELWRRHGRPGPQDLADARVAAWEEVQERLEGLCRSRTHPVLPLATGVAS